MAFAGPHLPAWGFGLYGLGFYGLGFQGCGLGVLALGFEFKVGVSGPGLGVGIFWSSRFTNFGCAFGI